MKNLTIDTTPPAVNVLDGPFVQAEFVNDTIVATWDGVFREDTGDVFIEYAIDLVVSVGTHAIKPWTPLGLNAVNVETGPLAIFPGETYRFYVRATNAVGLNRVSQVTILRPFESTVERRSVEKDCN